METVLITLLTAFIGAAAGYVGYRIGFKKGQADQEPMELTGGSAGGSGGMIQKH